MEDVSFYVLDADFNLIDTIDDYETVEFKYNYYDHSSCTATIEASERFRNIFISNVGDLRSQIRILVRSDELIDVVNNQQRTLTNGFIVETAIYTDENKSNIQIFAYSLSVIFSWRRVYRQQVYKGNLESALRYFVDNNCINTESRRVINNLTLGPLNNINIQVDEAFTDKQLDTALWDVCRKTETTFKVMLNHETKKIEFIVEQGLDRSAIQSINPNVVFSKEFENLLRQSYVDDKYNFKNSAFIAGEGSGNERTIVEIGTEITGWNRRETFFDARDLQSEYNENGEEMVIPPGEYNNLLTQRGYNKLKEYQRIQTFESSVNPYSQFIFNKDYFLGDIISNRNDEIGIIVHNRVVVANETFDRKGYSLDLEFGTAVPTLLDKIKRGVNNGS